MRIVAGIHKGRKIESPTGKDIRPTADRCRESLFNLLMHLNPNPVVDQRVLDLCCGTGALGLEALSRGASFATFIDQSKEALALTRKNCEKFKEDGRSKWILSDSSKPPRASEPVSLVMMDAPYHSAMILGTFNQLVAQGWLTGGTVLAFEQNHKEDFPELPNTETIRERVYGKTKITIVVYLG